MTANRIVRWLSFLILGIILYGTFGKSPSQKFFEADLLKQPLTNKFSENFESQDRLEDLFQADFSRWHQLTIQNNEFKIINNPVKNCLTNDLECYSLGGNSVSLETGTRYRGKQSLKLQAGPTQTAFGKKSAVGIRRHLFDFKAGDDIYFSGQFYIESEEKTPTQNLKNLVFMGFRAAPSSWRYRKEPGRFLLFDQRSYIASDLLYWLPKPEIYTQQILEEIEFPTNKWTRIRVHIKLSENDEDGLVEIWQDNKKVLYYPGKTLPENKTVYSIMELGILKHTDVAQGKTLYIDDIQIQDTDFF